MEEIPDVELPKYIGWRTAGPPGGKISPLMLSTLFYSFCMCGKDLAENWWADKQSVFHRHPLACGEHVLLHSLGRTPAIFKAQLVFSEGRRETWPSGAGREKTNLPFHCLSLKLEGRLGLPPRCGAEDYIDRAGPVVFARQRRCKLPTSRCLYSGDLEHGFLTCPFPPDSSFLEKGLVSGCGTPVSFLCL